MAEIHGLHNVSRNRAFCALACSAVAILLSLLGAVPQARAQTLPGSSPALITQPISESVLVTLSGNTRREALNPANDRGIVPDNLPLPHMILQLRRPTAQEQAFKALIDQLHDPQSPNFHHWLTAADVGAQFGPAASDIQTITGWLRQHGFAVNTVFADQMTIDYSGTAGQVRTAFHTEIHNLSVDGEAHIANMSDPQIPAALAPVVVGIVSLNDFKPFSNLVHAQSIANFTSGATYYVTPTDLHTIYNFNPLYSAGVSGQGQTIYIVEPSDIYTDNGQVNDWATFRSAFGLSGYSGSLTTVHPGGCTDPGVASTGEGEAIIDAEYASAGAPSAAIVMATCQGTTTSGELLALINLVQGANPPAIISNSYGPCEAAASTPNATFLSEYMTAVAEGISIFVAAGDASASYCSPRNAQAIYGVGVNGAASTPYNVAVGGTDYADTYLGTNSTYWSSSNQSNGSALSYIPEIPWNSTCGSVLSATANPFNGVTFGTAGFCNSTAGESTKKYGTIWGGSGGPSGCAAGTPQYPDVVSGTCEGYAKPSWQSGLLGNPADGLRDLPDVSMFASFDPWHHSYIICLSDPNNGGSSTPCTTSSSTWGYGYGGTSFGAPIWAGIQALINQKAGGRQGLPNYRLYQLAAKEYGTGGSSSCNSSNGNSIAASCIFYDVTLGDNDAPCATDTASGVLVSCYLPSGTYGVLSLSNSTYEPTFKTTTGWDFATGIGTVNVANLVNGWLSDGVPLTDAHDFNADNKSDIFWRDTSGNMAIWEMNGSAIVNENTAGLGGVPTIWSIISQHDFNGDGNADVLWRNTSGDLAIWEMNGTEILNVNTAGLGNVPTVWSVAGVGDFNGDGNADILWRNTSTGDLAIWEMNGTTILNANTAGLGNVPLNWSVVGIGDFNGDGKADILWRNATNGNVAIWEMNGTTVLNANTATFGNMPASWSAAGTGDFNGDGNSDILWRDGSGDIAIWEMNGTTILNPSTTGVGSLSTVWTVAETGDFNGDGKSDILWHDSSGDLAIWYMNGTTITSGAGLGTMPTSWTIQGTNAD